MFLSRMRIFLTSFKQAFFLTAKQKVLINHNKEIWKKQSNRMQNEILVEIFPVTSSYITFSYLANYLAKINNAKIVGYNLREKNLRGILFSRAARKIYKSFGTEKFIYLSKMNSKTSEKKQIVASIKKTIKTVKDVEDLKIENIYLGDLFYDSFLMSSRKPTIEIGSKEFEESLYELVGHYVYWRDYLKNNSVRAVVLSHCAYMQFATVLRIAVNNNIPVYQMNWSGIDYLTSNYLYAYSHSKDYPNRFQGLSREKQIAGIGEAKERIELRFSGKPGVDMSYSSVSAFEKNSNNSKRVLSTSSKTKVFVATHCFFDSPHGYGINLFPDFYEWIDFLGKMSEKTDYEWYLKTHRNFLKGTMPVLHSFEKKYPKLKVISPETSHFQLIDEGVDVVLTVYGTVGFEYAALGIPVINASACGPHSAYNFNLNPKSIEEYEEILLDLKNINLKIDKDEVFEFYFMHNLNNTFDWFMEGTRDSLEKLGSDFAEKDDYIPIYLSKFSKKIHENRLEIINEFITSKDNYLTEKHIRVALNK